MTDKPERLAFKIWREVLLFRYRIGAHLSSNQILATVGVLRYHNGDLEKAIRATGHLVSRLNLLRKEYPGYEGKWVKGDSTLVRTLFENLKLIRHCFGEQKPDVCFFDNFERIDRVK